MKTSRSKIVSWYKCPRYRYLTYHYGGKGLQRVSTKAPTQAGLSIHKGNALILMRGQIGRTIEEILLEYKESFPKGIPFHDELLQEQMCFIEGVIRAFNRCRLPKLKEEGKIIAIEQEHSLTLFEDKKNPVEFQFRADAIKEVEDGIIVIDFKPTSYGNYQFVKGWERNHQVLSYAWAAEELYKKPCLGIQIEGYVKGKRQFDKRIFNGEVKIQNSPLCYVWVNDVTGQISPEYQRSNGWEKTPLWETSLTPKEYIEDFLTFEQVEEMFLAPVPPISPNKRRLESWKTQTIYTEKEIEFKAEMVERIRVGGTEQLFFRVLDEKFPQNMDSCYKYGEDFPCECEQICFNDEVAHNVLESGLFEERVDHHSSEEEN